MRFVKFLLRLVNFFHFMGDFSRAIYKDYKALKYALKHDFRVIFLRVMHELYWFLDRFYVKALPFIAYTLALLHFGRVRMGLKAIPSEELSEWKKHKIKDVVKVIAVLYLQRLGLKLNNLRVKLGVISKEEKSRSEDTFRRAVFGDEPQSQPDPKSSQTKGGEG